MPDDGQQENDVGVFSRHRERTDVNQDAVLWKIFQRYGMSSDEASRISLNVLAAALPLLARGGSLVFREPDGAERAYAFPSLSKTENKAGTGKI